MTACPWPPATPGHYVHVKLPDGRDACASFDDPVVKVMRRILRATGLEHREADPRDYATVAEWLDRNGLPVQLELPLEAA